MRLALYKSRFFISNAMLGFNTFAEFLVLYIWGRVKSYKECSFLKIASILWIQSTTWHWSTLIFNNPLFDYLDTNCQKCFSPVYNASFDIFEAKIGRFFRFFIAKSSLKVSWDIENWTILLQNWLKSQFSRKFKYWLWT